MKRIIVGKYITILLYLCKLKWKEKRIEKKREEKERDREKRGMCKSRFQIEDWKSNKRNSLLLHHTKVKPKKKKQRF